MIRFLLLILLFPLRPILRFVLNRMYRRWNPHVFEDFGEERVHMVRELPGGRERWAGSPTKKAEMGNKRPWNRFFQNPMHVHARSLKDVERFLRAVRYMPDRAARGQEDFWELPEEFEKRRRGDCEDHAIWAWRQLFELGFETRLVVGTHGKGHHAWVLVFKGERAYMLETTGKDRKVPRPEDYVAEYSVQKGEGKAFLFFHHFDDLVKTRDGRPSGGP